MSSEKINTTVRDVVDLLATKAYGELECLCKGVRLSGSDIKNSVEEYGRTIVPIPAEGFSKIDVYEIEGESPKKWNVDVPVYTKEEGLSDLTLQLTLTDSETGRLKVEIDDLHVL